MNFTYDLTISKNIMYLSNSSDNFERLLHLPRGTCTIILSAAIYGLTTVLTKGALAHIPPLTLLFIQTASSAIFSWAIVFLQQIPVPLRWNTLRFGLAGLLEPGLSYILGMLGLSLTTASNAIFIDTAEPIITVALCWLILRERISLPLIGLGLLASLGMTLISASGSISVSQSAMGSMAGDCLIFLSVLFGSLYAITTPRSVKRLHPVVLAAIQQSVAIVLFSVVLLGAFTFNLESFEFTPALWGSVFIAIVSGAFGYGLAFVLYLAAVRHQPASKVSLYLTLVPLFGVIGAYFLLGERLMVSQGLGGSLILLAVIGITQLPRQK